MCLADMRAVVWRSATRKNGFSCKRKKEGPQRSVQEDQKGIPQGFFARIPNDALKCSNFEKFDLLDGYLLLLSTKQYRSAVARR
mmetsp:Transcript_3459/g.9845  ORF Transcript_3459/g.9845 Transcript_3459/m.9845 type:complete len:84 (+) Transcript_3459:2670-2921(+)